MTQQQVKQLKKSKMRNTHNITQKEYFEIHSWLRSNFPKPLKCQSKTCLKNSIVIQWALKKGKEYEKKRSNFLHLCKSCHVKYDWKENTSKKIQLSHKGRVWTEKQLKNRLKPVQKLSLNGKVLKTYPSLKSTNIDGYSSGNIIHCINGRYKHAYNFKWAYVVK